MHDIRYQGFISYAWDNDQPSTLPGPDGVCRGWVSTLFKELTRCLIQVLSRTLRDDRRDGLLWIDLEQVRCGDAITPQIEARLKASRLLLPILSPSWFDSPWCLKEFRSFLDTHRDGPQRVFPVWMRPVDPGKLTGSARDAYDLLYQKTGFHFHYRDGVHDRTRWDPIQDPQDREYLRIVADLAREMAERIADLVGSETVAGLAPAAQQSIPTQVSPSPTAPAEDHEILVNGGIEDAERIRVVAETLGNRRFGYAVPAHTQPDRALRMKPSQLRRDLRDKLRRCTAVLFVYCDGPPHQVDQQIDACDRAAAMHRGERLPPTLDLCTYGRHALGLKPVRLQVHLVDSDEECVETIIGALSQRSMA